MYQHFLSVLSEPDHTERCCLPKATLGKGDKRSSRTIEFGPIDDNCGVCFSLALSIDSHIDLDDDDCH